MSYRWFFLAAAGLALAAGARPLRAQSAPLYGLPYMARFDQLPRLKNAVCKQVSSYDRSGGNGDTGHYLNGDAGHLPNDTALLADLKGPGCVYRLWSANAAGHIRFFFDGEETPRIDCPMQDLFQNRYPPFQQPLAGQSSGGWYSYMPIPFEKSLRIEVQHPEVMYYQVEYHTYPAGTAVRSFTRELTPADKDALQTVLAQWQNRNQVPHPTDREQSPGKTATLKGGAAQDFVDYRGSGTIRELRVKADPATRLTLRDVALRIYWDGARDPAVEAPLGDFFGTGFGEQRFAAAPVKMDSTGYSCYFPMPFRHSFRVEVANDGKEPVKIALTAFLDPTPPPDDAAYFHARWRRINTEAGTHVTLLDTKGRGHFVGVNLNMQGHGGLGFLEGDEKIYVDGETFPSIYGTGTEDFFTSGWYFNTGPFDLPYHGCVVKDDPHSRISAYRYQITDCVPFRQSIKVDIEHGGVNDYPGADYAFTSYWYQGSPTDTWTPMPPVAARAPAVFHMQGATEAETLAISGGKTVTDERLPFEASGGSLVQVSGRSPLALKFDAPAESNYTVAVGVLRQPGAGQLQVTLDDKPLGEPIPLAADTARIDRVVIGTSDMLPRGEHTLGFRVSGGKTERAFAVDYLGLRRALYPGALEGERLRILEKSPANADLDPQGLESFGDRWSNDTQLWFRPPAAGSSFTVELPARTAGRYRVTGYFTKAIDYGRVQVSLDGKEIGPVFDGFHDGVVPSGPVELGEADLAAGNHRLKFTVVDKNPRSTGYMGPRCRGAPARAIGRGARAVLNRRPHSR